MRHPFDGIVPAPAKDRRSWLKGLLGVFAGLFAWNRAQAQVIEVKFVPAIAPVAPGVPVVIGPDGVARPVGGGGPNDPEPYDPRMSTAVRGEEGASVGGPGAPTTGAIREEGAATGARFEAGGPVTLARREAGGMTGALREGGGGAPVPVLVPPPAFTTLALGEEGGK